MKRKFGKGELQDAAAMTVGLALVLGIVVAAVGMLWEGYRDIATWLFPTANQEWTDPPFWKFGLVWTFLAIAFISIFRESDHHED